jgi:hypothetical protein
LAHDVTGKRTKWCDGMGSDKYKVAAEGPDLVRQAFLHWSVLTNNTALAGRAKERRVIVWRCSLGGGMLFAVGGGGLSFFSLCGGSVIIRYSLIRHLKN